MSDTLGLCKALVSRQSVTPDDMDCQMLIADHLEPLGFTIEFMPVGEVSNLWARLGTKAPLFVFAGHTDVVPPGPRGEWASDPFTPDEREGCLFGRGAADMKGSLAAMVTATERYLKEHPEPNGSIGFLLTSDEEGPALDGTVRVVEQLQARNERIDYCLVGEPSSTTRVGDVIKIGRRGSLAGKLSVQGTQGHVAYPHLADNPVHRAAPALAELCGLEWDQGNASFPPTTFQISNINAGTGADNVIPGNLELLFNFRYSTETRVDELKSQVTRVLDRHQLTYDIDWTHSGQPFLTERGALVDATRKAVSAVTGMEPELSTAGGTSDGRFIAPTGTQVVELGPVNATIHKVNECVRIADLGDLSHMYANILEQLLG